MQFTSFKKLNSGQYFRLDKNELSELLGGRMVPMSPVSASDLVLVWCELLVLGGSINMVEDCYGWSQVLLNSWQQ